MLKMSLATDGWGISGMNVTELKWWSVSIVSGNGLVPSGDKPLTGTLKPGTLNNDNCKYLLSNILFYVFDLLISWQYV